MSRFHLAWLLTLVFHSEAFGDSSLDEFLDSALCEKDECPATFRASSVAKTEELLEQAEPAAVSALSLLQTSSVSYRRSQAHNSQVPNHCPLKFLHIPKNMGGTIENFTTTNDLHILLYANGESHPNEYGIPSAGAVDNFSCVDFHIPPAFVPRPNRYTIVMSSGEEVFCIKRNPYERALSIYNHFIKVQYGWPTADPATNCTQDTLNEMWQYWMRRYLDGHRCITDRGDCMLYPQSLMIYGPDESQQWCQHILEMDEMPGTFNQLLSESGCDVRFEDDGRYDRHTADACPDLSVTDLTRETIAMINTHYRKDFELLGYEMREEMQ